MVEDIILQLFLQQEVMEDQELLLFKRQVIKLLQESGHLMTHIITRKLERGFHYHLLVQII